MSDDEKPGRRKPETAVGAGIAIGAGIGAVMFAATNNPVWIGVGAGVGAAVGAALQQRRP